VPVGWVYSDSDNDSLLLLLELLRCLALPTPRPGPNWIFHSLYPESYHLRALPRGDGAEAVPKGTSELRVKVKSQPCKDPGKRVLGRRNSKGEVLRWEARLENTGGKLMRADAASWSHRDLEPQ
jgi:hypothetical protein